MTADELVEKARRNLRSARLVLADGDSDSACNRAYYAMFSAARAALLGCGHAQDFEGKTHSGLIAAFGQRIVRPGLVALEHGRALSAIFQLRTRADYIGDGASFEDARSAIDKAEAFIAAIEGLAGRDGR